MEARPGLRNNKGFTLAELLIVVAIVAVLVSIAIPMFWTQLEKARERNDVGNARSAYSQVRTCAITGSTEGFDVDFDGVNYTKSFRVEQTRAGWIIAEDDHKIKGLSEEGSPEPNTKCVVSCNRDGEGKVYWNGIPNSYSSGTSWRPTQDGLKPSSTGSEWDKKVTAIDRPLEASMGSVVHVKPTDDEELKQYHFGLFFVDPTDPATKRVILDTGEFSFNADNTQNFTVHDKSASGYNGDVEIYIQLINPNGPAPDAETSKKLLELFSVEWKK